MILSGHIFLLSLYAVGIVSGAYKRWLRDTNFENPDNWNVKRAPCGNDVVIIPEESPVVYMQMNTTVKELVLPKSGEILLGRDVGLTFTTDSPSAAATDGCQDAGGDVEFTASNPVPWMDPSNWCLSPTETGACDVTSFILDTEQVPCTFDDVVFPRLKSFFVDISDFGSGASATSVKTFKIGGSSFTTDSFSTYLASTAGQRMFKTSGGEIKVTRKGCDDIGSCPCGNDKPEVASKICKYVEKRCKRPRCSDTIQPQGSCCRMCGAVFNITKGYGFNFNDFNTVLNDQFFKESSAINKSVSVMTGGWVQLVLTDLTGEGSKKLAQDIKTDMDNDLSKGGHKYAIDGVSLSLATGPSIAPQASKHSGASMGGGSIAGVVLAVLVVIIIIVFVVVYVTYKRSGRQLPVPKMPDLRMPTLPRLPRRNPRATARVPPAPQTAAHIDPGFANPLYDSSPFDDGNVLKEMELIETAKEEQPTFDTSDSVGFNNPLYGSSGPMFSDPTKADGGKSDQTGASPITDKPSTTVILDSRKDDPKDSTI